MEAVDVNSLSPGIPLYLWMLLFLLFLVMAFIGLVIYTSRKEVPRGLLPPQNKQAKRLKEQYDNGEINEEEFQNRMKKLEKRSKKKGS